MEKLELAYNLVQNIAPVTNSLDEVTFGSALCMIIEEYCREQHKDINNYILEIASLILEVNRELGTYQ